MALSEHDTSEVIEAAKWLVGNLGSFSAYGYQISYDGLFQSTQIKQNWFRHVTLELETGGVIVPEYPEEITAKINTALEMFLPRGDLRFDYIGKKIMRHLNGDSPHSWAESKIGTPVPTAEFEKIREFIEYAKEISREVSREGKSFDVLEKPLLNEGLGR